MDWISKLWDLANVVTGFAIVQSIATIFALAKGDLRRSMKTRGDHVAAFVFTLCFTTGYIYAIAKLKSLAVPFMKGGFDGALWTTVTWWRITAVVAFTLITLLTIVGHWKNRPTADEAPYPKDEEK